MGYVMARFMERLSRPSSETVLLGGRQIAHNGKKWITAISVYIKANGRVVFDRAKGTLRLGLLETLNRRQSPLLAPQTHIADEKKKRADDLASSNTK